MIITTSDKRLTLLWLLTELETDPERFIAIERMISNFSKLTGDSYLTSANVIRKLGIK